MDFSGKSIIDNFKKNVSLVEKLANFDRIVLDFAIKSLDKLQDRLKEKFENERLLATKTLSHLRSIRENDSMRPQYEEIFNQCVVLLVSYFGSAISDIFRHYVTLSISNRPQNQVLREELKFTIEELHDLGFNLSDQIGEIIARKKDISFQDMKSINRAFKDYLGIEMEKDKDVNNIILGQACRHVIVHSGAIADAKLIKQLLSASPRDLKEKIMVNSRIQFTTDELEILHTSMIDFLKELVEKLDGKSRKERAVLK